MFYVTLNKEMALINPLKDVMLISPLKWNAWDEVLRIKAKSSDLWGHINPSIEGRRLLERPTKPEVLDFPKYIHSSR